MADETPQETSTVTSSDDESGGFFDDLQSLIENLRLHMGGGGAAAVSVPKVETVLDSPTVEEIVRGMNTRFISFYFFTISLSLKLFVINCVYS
jgi:hypothetical protein